MGVAVGRDRRDLLGGMRQYSFVSVFIRGMWVFVLSGYSYFKSKRNGRQTQRTKGGAEGGIAKTERVGTEGEAITEEHAVKTPRIVKKRRKKADICRSRGMVKDDDGREKKRRKDGNGDGME